MIVWKIEWGDTSFR